MFLLDSEIVLLSCCVSAMLEIGKLGTFSMYNIYIRHFNTFKCHIYNLEIAIKQLTKSFKSHKLRIVDATRVYQS